MSKLSLMEMFALADHLTAVILCSCGYAYSIISYGNNCNWLCFYACFSCFMFGQCGISQVRRCLLLKSHKVVVV